MSSGWQRAVSRSTGIPYYFNSVLKKSFYSEAGLPDGWVFEWKDPKNNIKRYFNVFTNETAESALAIKARFKKKAPGQERRTEAPAGGKKGVVKEKPKTTNPTSSMPTQPSSSVTPAEEKQKKLADSVNVLQYPATKPSHRPYVLGWFYDSHKYIFDQSMIFPIRPLTMLFSPEK